MLTSSARALLWSLAVLMVAILGLPAIAAAASDPPPASGGGGSGSGPLKVFILAGQSNMQGHAHVRTLDAMDLDPGTAAILKEMRTADGAPRVCEDIWISSLGSASDERIGRLTAGFGAEAGGPKIGPEFTFGLYTQKLLDEPILIIKVAWGGKSLHTDFRPPGAGPYQFNEQQLQQFREQGNDVDTLRADAAAASGRSYRLMIDHIKMVLSDIQRVYPGYRPQQGYELTGFVWFQGWNDMVDSGAYPNRDRPGGYDTYSTLLTQFIRDVRRDLAAPDMLFLIGVMGVGGPIDDYPPEAQRYKEVHRNFRLAMAAPAALPEFEGSVAAVSTAEYWDMEVVALRAREDRIKPQIEALESRIKDGALSREDGEAMLSRLYENEFTARELMLLRESTSNFDFHYMGSARIVARIGKAFAETMVAMIEQRGRQ
ncbi:MAG: sialate O-acetylesterase [Phycisphaerales bacterium JB039]